MRTLRARRAWLWLLAGWGWVSFFASDISAGTQRSARDAHGGGMDAVSVSRHSRIQWRRELAYRKTPLPHLGGTSLERRDDQGRTRVWIASTTLKTRPTLVDVRREWQAGLEAINASRPGTRLYSEKCTRDQIGILCSSETGEASRPEFLAQRMWFREGVEKVLIQVRSSVSREHAAAGLAEFAILPSLGAEGAIGKGAR